MTGETGTRELADGRPGYRLVRREDVELRDALPGHSTGATSCRLVGRNTRLDAHGPHTGLAR